MGAIYGAFGGANELDLRRMGDRLAHRGAHVTHWSPAPGVHFGQRGRAAAPGAQLALLFEGVLDDLAGLARSLDADPEATRDKPAEAVLELYVRQGPAALAALNGQFALALWDAREASLLLARDRYGVRPLYYARAGERWAFASEYKALLALDDLPARPDLDAIQHVHRTKLKPRDSLLEGVRAVSPSGGVVLSERGAEPFRYWEPRVRTARRPVREHAQSVRAALLLAAHRQASSSTRPGIALSGGLDSAIALAALRHAVPDKTIHSFTGGSGPEDPEFAGAAEAARAFGTIHHEIVLRAEELPTLLPRVIWHIEDPIGREDNPYLYVTAREAAKHVDVLFSGYGADLLFAGMPRHKLVNLAQRLGPLRRPVAEFLYYAQAGVLPAGAAGRALVALYYRGKQYDPPAVIGARAPSPAPSLEPAGAQPLSEYLARALRDYPGKPQVEQLHAAFGLRFDAPFVDRDFVELAFEIPDALKIRRLWREKYILRAAFEDLLPPSLLRRRKTLQRMRHDLAFSEALDDLADRLLTRAAVRARGFFDPAYVDRVRMRAPRAAYPTERAYRLWSLITTELWAQLFLDARGAGPPA